MKIHYNNGQPEKEKVIDGVIAIQVIGANKPVTAVLPNGRELTISLDNIEMILDDSVTDDNSKLKEEIKKQVAKEIIDELKGDMAIATFTFNPTLASELKTIYLRLQKEYGVED